MECGRGSLAGRNADMIAEGENSKLHQQRLREALQRDLPPLPDAQAAPAPPAGKAKAKPKRPKRKVRLRIDEGDMQTTYGNAFRTIATPEEVILDFGRAEVRPSPDPNGPLHVTVKAEQRCIMTYYSAKRMVLLLGEVIRRYEAAFGKLEVRSHQIRQEFHPGRAK